ncbi:MAG: thermonuclease family protein [Dehalococcoidia bacterium]
MSRVAQLPPNSYPARWLGFLLLALVALLLTGCRSEIETPVFTGCQTTLCCEECELVSVSRVIDGDTFDSPSGRVRLYGVDTPERREPCYNRATRRFRVLSGDRVRVQPGPRSQDPGGRFLYYVYTENGESIDEKLVREGLGRAWTRDGQHRDLLTTLEAEAQHKGEGCLW